MSTFTIDLVPLELHVRHSTFNSPLTQVTVRGPRGNREGVYADYLQVLEGNVKSPFRKGGDGVVKLDPHFVDLYPSLKGEEIEIEEDTKHNDTSFTMKFYVVEDDEKEIGKAINLLGDECVKVLNEWNAQQI